MSPLDPEVPPAGEEVHLPGSSLLPLLTAVGITLILIGITINVALVVVGAVLTIWCVIRWIRDTHRDIDELPLG
jgi:membrane protein implicated in regulation of membrane protease activity